MHCERRDVMQVLGVSYELRVAAEARERSEVEPGVRKNTRGRSVRIYVWMEDFMCNIGSDLKWQFLCWDPLLGDD
jgi:hypothetical protein